MRLTEHECLTLDALTASDAEDLCVAAEHAADTFRREFLAACGPDAEAEAEHNFRAAYQAARDAYDAACKRAIDRLRSRRPSSSLLLAWRRIGDRQERSQGG